MPTPITVEDVERFRATDRRAVILARHRLVVRDDAATAAEHEIVYVVADQRVDLRLVPGGYTAEHACPSCAADTPCFRALAAVDAEGSERFIAECEHAYEAAKRAMVR